MNLMMNELETVIYSSITNKAVSIDIDTDIGIGTSIDIGTSIGIGNNPNNH